jgi:serine/threonine protein kinase
MSEEEGVWHRKTYYATERQDNEALIYSLLNNKGCTFAPIYAGLVKDDIEKKQSLIKKLTPSMEQILGAHCERVSYAKVKGYTPAEEDEAVSRAFATLPQFYDFAYQLALCITWLHTVAGVAHRDIKPENICYEPESMKRGDPRLMVIDYEFAIPLLLNGGGGAKNQHQIAAWSCFKGTTCHAPPEMIHERVSARNKLGGLPYDERCDVWSYVTTLINLFSGVDYSSEEYACNDTQDAVDRRLRMLIKCRFRGEHNGAKDTPKDAHERAYRELEAYEFLSALFKLRWVERPHFIEIVNAPVFALNLTSERRSELRRHYWGASEETISRWIL